MHHVDGFGDDVGIGSIALPFQARVTNACVNSASRAACDHRIANGLFFVSRQSGGISQGAHLRYDFHVRSLLRQLPAHQVAGRC